MKKSIFVIVLALIGTIAFQNCGPMSAADQTVLKSNGTYTGNVLTHTSYAMELSGALCERIAACHSAISEQDCGNQLLTIGGLPQAFGVPQDSALSTIKDVVDKEAYGALVNFGVSVNLQAEVACSTAISSLTCASSDLQAAYNANSKSLVGAIPLTANLSNCARVFGPL